MRSVRSITGAVAAEAAAGCVAAAGDCVSVAVGARVTDGRLSEVRVAMGSVAPTPLRARHVEGALEGRPLVLHHAPHEAGLEHALGHLRQPAIVADGGQLGGALRPRDQGLQGGLTTLAPRGPRVEFAEGTHGDAVVQR